MLPLAIYNKHVLLNRIGDYKPRISLASAGPLSAPERLAVR